MKILCVANCTTSSSAISGGDVRFVEIAKAWKEQGHSVHVLTSKAGVERFKRLGLDADYHFIDVVESDNLAIYGYHLLKSTFSLPHSLRNFQSDIVYSGCEQIRDVIPAFKIKRQGKGTTKLGVVVHWVPPFPPWKRKSSKIISSTLFYVNERIGLELARKYADVFLPVSVSTENQLLEIRMRADRLYSVECGIHYDKIQDICFGVSKKYDAVFMKRIQSVKGIFDLVEIWRKVIETKKDAKLLVIGTGPDEAEARVRIKNENMENNVEFAGEIYDINEKFTKLAQSKLFVLPSYEENWAIVIGEAMAAGLPVICYDLKELKVVWQDNYVGVPLGDKEQFAREIIKLLETEKIGKKIAEKAKKYVKKFDWREIAEKELAILRDS